jgi:transposase
MKDAKFTIKQFNEMFPNEEACLDWAFIHKYGDMVIKCPACKEKVRFYRVANRKCYSCGNCRYQIHPLAGTIFHKSSTSLKNWFYVMFKFANSRNGVSAKEIQRDTGVTYKTAWRMAKQVRLLFFQSMDILQNNVEVDETYVGGKGGNNKRGRGAEHKTPVVGLVERKGELKAEVTTNTKSSTVLPIIRSNVAIGSNIMTDEYRSYKKVHTLGYTHKTVNHAEKKYVEGEAHTNTLVLCERVCFSV